MPLALASASDTGMPFGVVQDQEEAREVDLAEDEAERRHDHAFDQRRDDAAEGRADDDADGEIDHVAPRDELLEFLQHRLLQRAEA